MKYQHEQYIDFIAYLMIHAAMADDIRTTEELALIQEKVGDAHYKSIFPFYENHASSEKTAYVLHMTKEWLHTDEAKNEMLRKVREMIGIDGEVDAEEKTLYAEMKRLILS